MKKHKIIKVLNTIKYFNCQSVQEHGIVIEETNQTYRALFLNEACLGDYIVKDIDKSDALVEKTFLPNDVEKALNQSLSELTKNAKDEFKQPKFNQFDEVVLLDETGKYKKFGLQSGDVGVIVESLTIKNKILVDFSKQTKENPYGDCVSINVSDLKKI